MLEELIIENYALIERVSLTFTPGFNVLTGETGAGKSILVGALGLILGQKCDNGIIRAGCDEAQVTGIIRPVMNPELQAWLTARELDLSDGQMIIRRSHKNTGRGAIFIQSKPYLRTDLEELSSLLFDMHSQHEHQSLFTVENHRKVLDRFGQIESESEGFRNLFTELTESRKKMQEMLSDEQNREREIDWLRSSVEEISKAALKPGEEEDLVRRQKILAGGEQLYADLERFLDLASETRGGGLAGMRQSLMLLEGIKNIDPLFSELKSRLESSFYEIEDIVSTLGDYQAKIQFSPEELARCDERLALISRLEKKYGIDIPAVLQYLETSRERLDSFENREGELTALKESISRLQGELRQKGEILTRKREAASLLLNQNVGLILAELGMEKAVFSVKVSPRQDASGNVSCGPWGFDRVEFLLSANPGEPLKPLASVASGGEISRVMLALKSALAEADTIGSLVFDEIDSGIGGKVGRALGLYMKKLSKYKQIFSITHLASIAVFADNHIRVEKDETDGRTFTRVRKMEGVIRVEEIARMLSGDAGGEVSLAHAGELLKQSGSV
jgi:DNA repair protein RecN (Recombination protein N)